MASDPIKKITLRSGDVRYRFTTDAPRGSDAKRKQVTHTFDTLKEAGMRLRRSGSSPAPDGTSAQTR